MTKLITFIIPSRYPENVVCFLNNLMSTTKNPANISVFVKFDDDIVDEAKCITDQLQNWPFDVKCIFTPRLEGVYSVAIAVEQLFFLSTNSYFIQILSDEPRFKSMHWDDILQQYKAFYPDHIFRLRLSNFKFKNYASNFECAVQPDSFPIYTRRWLELTQGTGDCWGSDAYHQCVAFHLGIGSKNYDNFYSESTNYRDIPIINIEMEGIDFGVGLTPEVRRQRTRRNVKEWNRLSSFSMQEHFSYLARRIDCAIYANKHNIKHFTLKRNNYRKTVSLLNKQGKKVIEISYSLPRIFIYFQNLRRRIKTFPRLLLSRLKNKLQSNTNTIKSIESAPEKAKNVYFNFRLAARSIINRLIIPLNNKPFDHKRPGISMLHSNKPDLCIGVNMPTQQEIAWLDGQLKTQNSQQLNLQNKEFINLQ